MCGSVGRKSVAESFFFVGSLIGGPIFGWLSDNKGRKLTLYVSNIITAIAGTFLVFYANFYYFSAFIFILGLTTIPQLSVSYVLSKLKYVL